jgi:hypothetical protein
MHLYCCWNTRIHAFSATSGRRKFKHFQHFVRDVYILLRKLPKGKLSEFIYWVDCLECRNGYWVADLEIVTGMASRHVRARSLKFTEYLSHESLQKGFCPQFHNLERRALSFCLVIDWFQEDCRTETLMFPNCKQKRAIFSLGDRSCRLTTAVIKFRNSAGPGNVLIKVIPPASAKVLNFERNANRLPKSPISNSLVKPSVLQLNARLYRSLSQVKESNWNEFGECQLNLINSKKSDYFNSYYGN